LFLRHQITEYPFWYCYFIGQGQMAKFYEVEKSAYKEGQEWYFQHRDIGGF